jgi:hypothetical protein
MSAVIELSAATRQRLARLLGVMGSDHDGEVLNAARMADRLVREQGATWHEVVGSPTTPGRQPPGFGNEDVLAQFPTVGAAAWFCRCWPELLSPWERDFVASIPGFRRLSPKQAAVLRKLVLRVMAAGARP